MRFYPVLGTQVAAANVVAMARPLQAAARATGASRAELIAAVAMTTLCWTATWARMIQVPPLPLTAGYVRALHESMMQDWVDEAQFTKTTVRSCLGRSVLGAATRKAAHKRCRKILILVRRLAAQAPAVAACTDLADILHTLTCPSFPRRGYYAALFLAL